MATGLVWGAYTTGEPHGGREAETWNEAPGPVRRHERWAWATHIWRRQGANRQRGPTPTLTEEGGKLSTATSALETSYYVAVLQVPGHGLLEAQVVRVRSLSKANKICRLSDSHLGYNLGFLAVLWKLLLRWLWQRGDLTVSSEATASETYITNKVMLFVPFPMPLSCRWNSCLPVFVVLTFVTPYALIVS